jgi:hypothetical protein
VITPRELADSQGVLREGSEAGDRQLSVGIISGTLLPSPPLRSQRSLRDRETGAMLKIAVVTPYYIENEDILQKCHESVLRQSYPCTHILVADGHPKSLFDEQPKAMHIILPQANGDMGNTPRAIGGILADAYGFDGSPISMRTTGMTLCIMRGLSRRMRRIIRSR